jgi:D-sedoheptulose 7-phosphate isomerase
MSAFDAKAYWQTQTIEHNDVAAKTIASLQNDFNDMLKACTNAIRNGNKIMFLGNGGSAADAQHLATELSVRYIDDRPPIAGIALTTDTSTLTACGNDYGFEHVFSRQIEAIGNKGDVVIAISTSGNSPNVTKAITAAKKKLQLLD